MSNRDLIEELRQELELLSVASQKARSAITSLEQQLLPLSDRLEDLALQLDSPLQNSSEDTFDTAEYVSVDSDSLDSVDVPATPVPLVTANDRDGNPIYVGDHIIYLTKGKYPSTEGIVSRFSHDLSRVLSLDNCHREIARAPRNVRVTHGTRRNPPR